MNPSDTPTPRPSTAPAARPPLLRRPPLRLPPPEPARARSAPAPGAVPEDGSRRELLLPLVLWAAALVILLCGCAQLEVAQAGADAGPGLQISSVDPAPGAAVAPEELRVSFSAPMDASLLLSDVDRSETVALVPLAQVEVATAALGHARLTAREKALLVPALAAIDADATSLSLSPEAPLAPGDYALLVSPRLRGADGRKLTGTLRFDYQVQAAPPKPALVSPAPGSIAPRNLRRVRLDLPQPRPGAVLALAGPSGPVAAVIAPDDAGPATIELCPGDRCPTLQAGREYAVLFEGQPVVGASFTIGDCARERGPEVRGLSLSPGAAAADLALQLDWPALVRAEWAQLPADPPAGSDDALLDRLCASGACRRTEGAARCAPASCAGAAAEAPCAAALSIDGLLPASTWLLRISIADDEGHELRQPASRLSTLAPVPAVILDEVMASPPLPAPRGDGEYLELFNPGPGAADLARLALQGPDGAIRPLLATPPPTPLLLPPGARALAVGASFDASRYPLPAGLPVLRASTQRLLGRGLADDASQVIVLLALPTGDAPAPVELSRFPGGGPACPEGHGLERIHPDPKPGAPLFQCGAAGGSPGRAP